MGRGTVRWIAIAVIGAMLAFLAVGLIGGRGDPAGSDADGGARQGADGVTLATDDAALDGPHVILELCSGVACEPMSATARDELLEEVAGDPRVASTRFVSSEQAYQLFLDEFGDDQELVEQVDPATVPPEIQVDLHRPDDVGGVIAEFEGRDGVAAARDARDPAVEP